MRLSLSLIIVIGWSSLSGCALFQDFYKKQAKAQDDYHDEYRVAGDEGRADIPREKETDGLTPLLQSEKARAIEKNLGID